MGKILYFLLIFSTSLNSMAQCDMEFGSSLNSPNISSISIDSFCTYFDTTNTDIDSISLKAATILFKMSEEDIRLCGTTSGKLYLNLFVPSEIHIRHYRLIYEINENTKFIHQEFERVYHCKLKP